MTTFSDWWNGVRDGLEDTHGFPTIKRRLRALCQLAWDAGADERAKRLRAWEGMADAEPLTGQHAQRLESIDRAVRGEPPADVEELIQRLNTRGGVCHREHADMIRRFVRKGYGDEQG